MKSINFTEDDVERLKMCRYIQYCINTGDETHISGHLRLTVPHDSDVGITSVCCADNWGRQDQKHYEDCGWVKKTAWHTPQQRVSVLLPKHNVIRVRFASK